MDLTVVHALRGSHRIGRDIQYDPVVASTMDVARTRAEAGEAEGFVALAGEQTAGRGRLGRAWVAPPDVNLYLSILLRPSLPVIKRLGMIAPLAVAAAVRQVSGLEVAFKWPNDVRIGERKLCGILIDAAFAGETPAYAVAGIGLNVNLDTDGYPEIRSIATSIAQELGRPVSREATLAALLTAFERSYDEPDGESLRLAWRARLETIGRRIDVRFGDLVEHGVAEEIDSEGSLLLRRDDGTLVVLPAGEVTLRAPEATGSGR